MAGWKRLSQNPAEFTTQSKQLHLLTLFELPEHSLEESSLNLHSWTCFSTATRESTWVDPRLSTSMAGRWQSLEEVNWLGIDLISIASILII
jgi:hypothetical protein